MHNRTKRRPKRTALMVALAATALLLSACGRDNYEYIHYPVAGNWLQVHAFLLGILALVFGGIAVVLGLAGRFLWWLIIVGILLLVCWAILWWAVWFPYLHSLH